MARSLSCSLLLMATSIHLAVSDVTVSTSSNASARGNSMNYKIRKPISLVSDFTELALCESEVKQFLIIALSVWSSTNRMSFF